MLRAFRRMASPLVWIDCEMTGLNHRSDRIIEICCLVTNGNLDLIEPQGFERVIHVDQAKLDGMDEWCQNTHSSTGLIGRVLASQNTREQVDADLVAYLKQHVPEKRGVLAGNSVHVDRLFMLQDLPKTVDYLHYRIVDVSSLKEIGVRHNPELMKRQPAKKLKHSAREDILESINELKWYYNNYLIPAPSKGDVSIQADSL